MGKEDSFRKVVHLVKMERSLERLRALNASKVILDDKLEVISRARSAVSTKELEELLTDAKEWVETDRLRSAAIDKTIMVKLQEALEHIIFDMAQMSEDVDLESPLPTEDEVQNLIAHGLRDEDMEKFVEGIWNTLSIIKGELCWGEPGPNLLVVISDIEWWCKHKAIKMPEVANIGEIHGQVAGGVRALAPFMGVILTKAVEELQTIELPTPPPFIY